jgi:hypothetical protein
MSKIFVFGSNEAGIHGAGAAKVAMQKHGYPFGKSYGHYGDAFGIPTKDERIATLPELNINLYVNGFIAYAMGRPKLEFKVTQIGCGLAGYTAEQIAPMFKGSPKNCYFDGKWKHILGDQYNYWGNYEN